MARLISGQMSADGASHESHIAEYVEEFVACGLILPLKGTHLEESEVTGVAMLYAEAVSQTVEVGLRHDAVVDDESIGEVAAANEAHLNERRNLANEDEGTGCGEIGREAPEIVKISTLGCNEFAVVEIDVGFDREVRRRRARHVGGDVGGFYTEPTTTLRITIFDGVADGEIVAGLILLKKADAANLLNEVAAAAIENGELGAIDLDKAVVDAASEECRHGVLNSRNSHVVIVRMRNDGSARGVDNVLRKCGDDGFTRQIYALHLKSVSCRSCKERGREVKTCMKALAAKGKRS